MSTLDDLRKLRDSEAPRFINPHPRALLAYTIRLAEAAAGVVGNDGDAFDEDNHRALRTALDAPIEGLMRDVFRPLVTD